MCCLVHHYHPSLLPLEKIRHETTNTQSAEHLRKEEIEARGTDNWEEELQGQWTTSFSPSQCLLLLPISVCVCCLWENGGGNGQLIVATIDHLFSVSSLQTVPDRRSKYHTLSAICNQHRRIGCAHVACILLHFFGTGLLSAL